MFDATNLDADSLSDSVTAEVDGGLVDGGSVASSSSSVSRRGTAKIRVYHSTYDSLNKAWKLFRTAVEDTQWVRKITKLNKIAGDRYNFKCCLKLVRQCT